MYCFERYLIACLGMLLLLSFYIRFYILNILLYFEYVQHALFLTVIFVKCIYQFYKIQMLKLLQGHYYPYLLLLSCLCWLMARILCK